MRVRAEKLFSSSSLVFGGVGVFFRPDSSDIAGDPVLCQPQCPSAPRLQGILLAWLGLSSPHARRSWGCFCFSERLCLPSLLSFLCPCHLHMALQFLPLDVVNISPHHGRQAWPVGKSDITTGLSLNQKRPRVGLVSPPALLSRP